MGNNIIYLSLIFCTSIIFNLSAQNDCTKKVEQIVGEKGTTYSIPCEDMVIMDLHTYTQYRYVDNQYHKLASTIGGYTNRLDSLDKESLKNKELMEEKIKDKDHIIEMYKEHSEEMTSVLEKCKENSEGFVKAYQEKVDENNKLESKIKKVKKQRNTFMGVSGGLGILLVVVLLL